MSSYGCRWKRNGTSNAALFHDRAHAGCGAVDENVELAVAITRLVDEAR
jgi:hypothetical protein